MSSVMQLNPKAEYARSFDALQTNAIAAKGLLEVMKTNLGPMGTVKMLVSGSGGVKVTKDGNVLLHEMQITHPTASLIAKVSTAQNDTTGDGTTSVVILIGELMKQAEMHVSEGVHPRTLVEGIQIGHGVCQKVLVDMKLKLDDSKDLLLNVCRTAMRTKLVEETADHMAKIVTDAFLAIRSDDKPVDLHMIEQMEMQHQSVLDSTLIRGLVLDHGVRHPNMKKQARNAYILICNVSLEYEKTEVAADLLYTSAEEREAYFTGERAFIEDRVRKIINLKRMVCGPGLDAEKDFVVINQKGIDPPSLELLAKEGIMALRRAKRRNMERLMLACGGEAVNSVDNLTPQVLGFAGSVYEHVLGENKYTFVEDCKNPKSVTILVKGPTQYSIDQIKDAVYDGLRALKNCIDDGAVIPGAGAFEVTAYCALMKKMDDVEGRKKLGIQALADALLMIVKSLAGNAGFDASKTALELIDKYKKLNAPVGVNLDTGTHMFAEKMGVYDNYCVKKNIISSCCIIASDLLLVDEILRSGVSTKKGGL